MCVPVFTTNSRGFTLIELMIAMAISGVVAMAAFTIFRTANWSSHTQEQLAEAQQNARAVVEQMSRDIRVAGFGLPDPPFTLSFNNIPAGTPSNLSAPITLINSATGPDSIIVLGIGRDAGELAAFVDHGDPDCNGSGDSKLCLNDVTAFSGTSGWVVNRRYISIDGTDFYELADTQVNLSDKKINLKTNSTSGPASLLRSYASDSRVFIIQAVRYSIATDLTNCSVANPCLATADYTMLRGGATPAARQVFADNVEDIQVSYSLRTNSTMLSPSTAVPFASIDISALRVSVVARTRTPDNQGGNSFSRPALEDRPAGSGDNYRRRVLSSVIKVRNPRYAN